MKIVVPFTLLSIFVLLYLSFRRLTETLIVMLSVPFALVGGIWLMWSSGTDSSRRLHTQPMSSIPGSTCRHSAQSGAG